VILAAGSWPSCTRVSYTRQTTRPKWAPGVLRQREQTVNVPIWAGVALAVVGGGLLLSGRSRAHVGRNTEPSTPYRRVDDVARCGGGDVTPGSVVSRPWAPIEPTDPRLIRGRNRP